MLCLDELGTQVIFKHMCLILLPGSIMRSGLYMSPFFMVLRMWLLLVRPACIAIKMASGTDFATVLYRLVSVFPFKRGGKARSRTGFYFTVLKRPVPGLAVPLWLKGLTWRVGLRLIQVGKKSAGCSVSASSADARNKGAMGVGTPDVSQSTASSSFSSMLFQVGMLSHF